MDCSSLSQGCLGGFNYLVGRYAQDQGLVNENCNAYTGTDMTCDTDPACSKTYVDSFSYVGGYFGGCSEEQMMESLFLNGPLAVAFNVEDDFYNYEGGIYSHTAQTNSFNPLVVSIIF